MSLTIKRVLPSQRRRLSELGYTNDDIKDLQQNPQKLNQIIEKGTVKTGATDQQIVRQQAKDLKIKNQATRAKDANQEHVTKWLAKLNKQGIKVSEKTIREAIASGDAKTFLGSKGISINPKGGIPWGVINSMENVINYETKYDSKQDKPEAQPELKGLNLTIPTSVQQKVEKVDTQIKIEDTKANNQVNSEIPVSKDNNPIINGEIAQIASAGGIGGLGIGPKTNNDQLTIKNESKPETTVKKNTNALGIDRKKWALMTKPQRKAARLSIK